MKDPATAIAIAADWSALSIAATPTFRTVICLFNSFLFEGHVVLTRPRLTALFDCRGEKGRLTERARGRRQSSTLGPAAFDVVAPSSERSGAYDTSHPLRRCSLRKRSTENCL